MMNNTIMIKFEGEYFLGISELLLDNVPKIYSSLGILEDPLESCWGYTQSELPNGYRYLSLGDDHNDAIKLAIIARTLVDTIAKFEDIVANDPDKYEIIHF